VVLVVDVEASLLVEDIVVHTEAIEAVDSHHTRLNSF